MNSVQHWTYAWIFRASTWRWLFSGPWWFVDLFLSGTVGAVIGYLVGDAVARRTLDSVVANIFINDAGIAQPLQGLTTLAALEDKNLKISFDPPELQQSEICEYSRIMGKSHTEVWLNYMSKYSMCFSVTDRGEKDWVVRPKKGSLDLDQRNGVWRCKCTS